LTRSSTARLPIQGMGNISFHALLIFRAGNDVTLPYTQMITGRRSCALLAGIPGRDNPHLLLAAPHRAWIRT
jgi:hypothetical protein